MTDVPGGKPREGNIAEKEEEQRKDEPLLFLSGIIIYLNLGKHFSLSQVKKQCP